MDTNHKHYHWHTYSHAYESQGPAEQHGARITNASGAVLFLDYENHFEDNSHDPISPYDANAEDYEVSLMAKGEESMKKQIGLWIDHRETIIVTLGEQGEETRRIESGMEKHVRFSGGSESGDRSGEDQRDRRFTEHLNKYYDEVIGYLREAESILIFGPGEAKGELKARLEREKLGARIVAVETEDKMTEPQIAAKVRQHFRK